MARKEVKVIKGYIVDGSTTVLSVLDEETGETSVCFGNISHIYASEGAKDAVLELFLHEKQARSNSLK